MQPLIAGNWKMNLNLVQSIDLARQISRAAGELPCELAVFPPVCYLRDVAQALVGSPVSWGAQNVHFEPNGAFTGEISVTMLADLGCQYTIIGHSERRQLFGETDESVNRKLLALLTTNIRPIVCVGETLDQREAGETRHVVRSQMNGSLATLTAEQIQLTTIAYEPVWAIGTGRTATPQQAQEVHADLRKWLTIRYNETLASSVRILYGGSVKPDNARELIEQPDINGALVGGASLKAGDFLAICQSAQK